MNDNKMNVLIVIGFFVGKYIGELVHIDVVALIEGFVVLVIVFSIKNAISPSDNY